MKQTNVQYGSAEDRRMLLERSIEDGRVIELAALNNARRMGFCKGFCKGLDKGQREVMVEAARELKKMNMPAHCIAEATGLPKNEIMQL